MNEPNPLSTLEQLQRENEILRVALSAMKTAMLNMHAELCRAAPAGGDEPGWQDGWPMPYHARFRDVLEQTIGQPFGEGTRLSSPDIRLVAMAMAREFGTPTSKPDSAPAVGRPYGGDPAEPRDDSDRYDSAPAGSGEVDPRPHRVEYSIFQLEQMAMAGPLAFDAMAIREAAALLRKLQQGAEYVPAFWNVRKDGKHLILFPLNGSITIESYLEMVAGAHPGSVIDAEKLYRAASQGQEGGHARD